MGRWSLPTMPPTIGAAAPGGAKLSRRPDHRRARTPYCPPASTALRASAGCPCSTT